LLIIVDFVNLLTLSSPRRVTRKNLKLPKLKEVKPSLKVQQAINSHPVTNAKPPPQARKKLLPKSPSSNSMQLMRRGQRMMVISN
jgi:hypothetical protein